MRVIKAAQGVPFLTLACAVHRGPDGGLAVARASYVAGASGIKYSCWQNLRHSCFGPHS